MFTQTVNIGNSVCIDRERGYRHARPGGLRSALLIIFRMGESDFLQFGTLEVKDHDALVNFQNMVVHT